jgi:alpha-glucosidase (family GH31 glycosyl hydrolase)
VFTKYADSNVALEGVFIDNYNSQPHYTYTVDDTRFPNISGHVEDLHAASKRVIFGTSYALHNNKTDNYWYNVSIKHSALINSSNFMYMGEQTTGVLD